MWQQTNLITRQYKINKNNMFKSQFFRIACSEIIVHRDNYLFVKFYVKLEQIGNEN